MGFAVVKAYYPRRLSYSRFDGDCWDGGGGGDAGLPLASTTELVPYCQSARRLR
jgi:hypothetical protein